MSTTEMIISKNSSIADYFADLPKRVQEALLEGERAVAEGRCVPEEQVFQEIDAWLQNG
ncbi:MAG: hypothetical protein LBH00_02745 [Planctomycetaceae bacterium]|jgi:predicted transcriptional regulator|nr:hypothetical protein [Planctomycetaceae bacterium]